MKYLILITSCLFNFIVQDAVATSFSIVQSNQDLNNVCKRISSQKYIAVDLEFDKREPCLIQVCWGEGEHDGALIDYLALDKVKPKKARHALGKFKVILDDPNITKVFHAPAQDLKILYSITGTMPKSIVDTQAMYATIKPHYQAGYAAVVEDMLNEKLDKTQQCSSWKTRPLSAEQLVYATNDVTHLYRLYPLLLASLSELNRLSFMNEYFARTLSVQSVPQKRTKEAFHSINCEDKKELDPLIRSLMTELKEKAAQLSMAPQMLATRSNLLDVLTGDENHLVLGERGQLLGWKLKFLLETYSENPFVALSWTKVVQSISQTKSD
jgi:ribonuclease D